MLNEHRTLAKTKILVTLGPATNSVDSIRQLIRIGADGVRLNLSHGSFNFFEELFNSIHSACSLEKSPLAILVDLQGPKIRIGELETPSIELQNGRTIEITIDDVLGTEKLISTSYKELVKDAEVGNDILINDGLIKLTIKSKSENSVICEVINGGILTPKKGMNLPGMKLSTPSVTKKDYEN